jgi:hypothetical protein
MSWREPGIIIVCSYTRDDGYYYPQSFDYAYRGLTDDRNAPIWPTTAPDRTDAPPDSLSGIASRAVPAGFFFIRM